MRTERSALSTRYQARWQLAAAKGLAWGGIVDDFAYSRIATSA